MKLMHSLLLIAFVSNLCIAQTSTIPSDFETYTNSKLGFTFQYPSSWVKVGEDVEAINLSGQVMAVEIRFADAKSQTSLLVTYHLPPNGATLYKYAVEQFESSQSKNPKNVRRIDVAGTKGIEMFGELRINGRGDVVSPALKKIIIDFLDTSQTREIEIELKTPLLQEAAESVKLDRLLSTFKFLVKN